MRALRDILTVFIGKAYIIECNASRQPLTIELLVKSGNVDCPGARRPDLAIIEIGYKGRCRGRSGRTSSSRPIASLRT